MSQNARVARWVPTADPDSVGENVITNSVPNANNVIQTKFALGGSGGGVAFASDAEMETGTEALKAVAPITYRDELVRLLEIPSTDFANAIAAAAFSGAPGQLVKTDAFGRLDAGFMPAIIDGGTF
jgi:hypothetical protein